MSNIVRDILTEELVLVDINDSVQEALKKVENIRTKNVAIQLPEGDFWITSSWNLRSLNPNITLQQTYNAKKEIFERVGTVSSDEEISRIITDLYELPGLIVFEEGNIKGFVSLTDFLGQDPISIIKQKAKMKGGLAGIDLHESDLKGIDLRNADLRGANLSMADLSKAKLRGANLTGANLSGANLTDANLVRAKLDRATLKDTVLINADLRHAELWHADLEGAKLKGANLRETVLYVANLRSANLEGADLFDAGLMSAILEGADLNNANIRGANLKRARFDEKTNLRGAEVDNITIGNLTVSALEANWDPETKRIIREKYG